MPRPHDKNTNNIKARASIFSPKLTSAVEMFVNENCLDEPKDMESKRRIICFIKEFRVYRRFNKIAQRTKKKELQENKRLNDVHENTVIRLMEMMKTIQDLRMEFIRR